MKDRLVKAALIRLWELLKGLGFEPITITVTTSTGEFILMEGENAAS